MSGKCDKSLKTAFLKITNFCNISENHPNKSKALSQNVPKLGQNAPYRSCCFSKTTKKDLHVHFLTKNSRNQTNRSCHFLPPPRIQNLESVWVFLAQNAKTDPSLRSACGLATLGTKGKPCATCTFQWSNQNCVC